MKRHYLLTAFILLIASVGFSQSCTCNGLGPELVANGDFSQGNTGFTTTYTYASFAWPGNYGITNDASLPNPGSWSACHDHTTGNGNLMWVDASQTGYGLPLWTEVFPVLPNTNYVFSFWFENVNNDSISNPPGTVQFGINNVNLGPLLTAPNLSCVWMPACIVWNSGNNTTATVSIMNMAAYFNGNDFGFDDISFRECQSNPCNIVASANAPITICTGQTASLTASGGTSYSWIPSSSLSSSTIANPIAAPTVTTTYSVIVGNGTCYDTATTTVIVNPLPVVVVSPNTTVCTGNSVNLSSTGGGTYAWLPTTALNNPNISNPISTPTGPITYTVTVTQNGCVNTGIVSLNVTNPPNPQGNNATICIGHSTQLNVTGGNSYAWAPTTGLSNPQIGNPIASPTVTTVYTVTATNGTCTSNTTVTVYVTPQAVASMNASATNGEAPLTVNFTNQSTNATSILFIVGNGDTTFNGNFSMTFNDAGTYYVYLVAYNSNGCPDTTMITIDVTPVSTIFVPNAFTPQADGINDIFKAETTGIVEFKAWLFDRWGKLFYTWDNKDGGWDGTYQGKVVQEDVYVWKIRALGVEGKHYNLVGHVSVIK